MTILTCPVCAGTLQVLPVPRPDRAILSDGRIVALPLAKGSCVSCGLACHLKPADQATIRSFYEDSYSLSAASPAADHTRAAAYATCLADIAQMPSRALEIGCGSGNLLKALRTHWPASVLFGIDPALPAHITDVPGITYWRDFFDGLPQRAGGKSYDLIFSINVIEHLHSPRDFFALSATLLAPDGKFVIVCPSSEPANLELLFHDHLHTFTFESLALMANACGLVAVRRELHLPGLGDFQLAVFSRTANMPSSPASNPEALTANRRAYLHAWAQVDDALLWRIGDANEVAMFGGGQMAAMLRCYAPLTWERVSLLLMDNTDDAWSLGKPVASYIAQAAALKGRRVIVATAPASQAEVAARLAADRIATVRFDDIITH